MLGRCSVCVDAFFLLQSFVEVDWCMKIDVKLSFLKKKSVNFNSGALSECILFNCFAILGFNELKELGNDKFDIKTFFKHKNPNITCSIIH